MKIKVISLKDSIDRRKDTAFALSNIPFDFFDAEYIKDNKSHFIYSLYDSKKSQQLKGYKLTVAELGCFASHISLWKECLESNENFLVIEDNIAVLGDLSAQLENINSLTTKYGVIKLGNFFHREHIEITKIDDNYTLISNLKGACGTSAYAISPNAAERYLKHVHGFFEPVDDFMDAEWRSKQTIYSYEPWLISRNSSASTIGGRKNKNNRSRFNLITSELYRSYKRLRQKIYNMRKKI
ncbi:glycosyltransferase family 25 protein [Vibrio sp. IRLE0018]|uniref:glycosyltransferase family 25 protein n=1 Tax=Vibrio floridensis TaxID=2908007 RepID=UPI001F27A0AA|nr:glycosyltransferase family 25 protein [Vibrio floridensis]MCF8780177.1 glycosyltransferase family 25 protein [Vibrio floridensis]